MLAPNGGTFEEKAKQDETFTPGWGMYMGSIGVPSRPGGAQHWHKPKRQCLRGTGFFTVTLNTGEDP